MMKKWTAGLLLLGMAATAKAQFYEANVLTGEFGVSVGAAHYFGDLNTRGRLNRPKLAAGVMFRKQMSNYIALRLQGTYARVGYSDVHSKDSIERVRNLSFNSDIYELSLVGDFNFFRFIPGERNYRFTPFVSLGVGFAAYDPFAYLRDEKYFLRPLGTEGQGSSQYPDRKPYGTTMLVLPVGVGIKYSLSQRTNLTFEISHRFTNTDYLDDVSTTYAGADVFPNLPSGAFSPAYLLQDRSYETVPVPIGIAGRQRGNSRAKDQYVTAMIGITFNMMSYRCPSAR